MKKWDNQMNRPVFPSVNKTNRVQETLAFRIRWNYNWSSYNYQQYSFSSQCSYKKKGVHVGNVLVLPVIRISSLWYVLQLLLLSRILQPHQVICVPVMRFVVIIWKEGGYFFSVGWLSAYSLCWFFSQAVPWPAPAAAAWSLPGSER